MAEESLLARIDDRLKPMDETVMKQSVLKPTGFGTLRDLSKAGSGHEIDKVKGDPKIFRFRLGMLTVLAGSCVAGVLLRLAGAI